MQHIYDLLSAPLLANAGPAFSLLSRASDKHGRMVLAPTLDSSLYGRRIFQSNPRAHSRVLDAKQRSTSPCHRNRDTEDLNGALSARIFQVCTRSMHMETGAFSPWGHQLLSRHGQSIFGLRAASVPCASTSNYRLSIISGRDTTLIIYSTKLYPACLQTFRVLSFRGLTR
jgi:hypothetical protein